MGGYEGEPPAIPLTVEECERRLGTRLDLVAEDKLCLYIRGYDQKDKPITKEFAERLTQCQWTDLCDSQRELRLDGRPSWCLSVVRLRPSLGPWLWNRLSGLPGRDETHPELRAQLLKPPFCEELVSYVKE